MNATYLNYLESKDGGWTLFEYMFIAINIIKELFASAGRKFYTKILDSIIEAFEAEAAEILN